MHFQVIRNTDEFQLRGNMPAIRELFLRSTALMKLLTRSALARESDEAIWR